jgi:hypothetical protein
LSKLYTKKTALTAADILNDRVIPFFDEQQIRIDRMLTDRGTEYCGTHDRHEYELYLAIEDIDHTRWSASAKGKARTRFEFGVKVSLATTDRPAPGGQFVIGARALPGNPFDGHTLAAQIAQTERITGVPV